jgi:hypothetical protein
MSDEQNTLSAFALLLPQDVKFGNSFQIGKRHDKISPYLVNRCRISEP